MTKQEKIKLFRTYQQEEIELIQFIDWYGEFSSQAEAKRQRLMGLYRAIQALGLVDEFNLTDESI